MKLKLNKFKYHGREYLTRNDYPEYLYHWCTGINHTALKKEQIRCNVCKENGLWHACYNIDCDRTTKFKDLRCIWCLLLVPNELAFCHSVIKGTYNYFGNVCFNCTPDLLKYLNEKT